MAICNVTFTQTTLEVKDKTGAVIYEYSTTYVWEDGIICEACCSLTGAETEKLIQFLTELFPDEIIEDQFDVESVLEEMSDDYPEYLTITEERTTAKTEVDVWALVEIEPYEDTPYVDAIFPTLAEAKQERETRRNRKDIYLYPMTYGNGIDMETYRENFGSEPVFTED